MTTIDISPKAMDRLAWLLQYAQSENAIKNAKDDAANALRVLSAALTKAQADAAKATAWAIEQHGAADRYASAMTESRAETAAAYERAARICEDRNDEIWDRDTGEKVGLDGAAEKIRALTPADAIAARDRMIADSEARGMQRAADIAKLVAGGACDTPDEIRGAAMVEYAILAAIPKGGDA